MSVVSTSINVTIEENNLMVPVSAKCRWFLKLCAVRFEDAQLCAKFLEKTFVEATEILIFCTWKMFEVNFVLNNELIYFMKTSGNPFLMFWRGIEKDQLHEKDKGFFKRSILV